MKSSQLFFIAILTWIFATPSTSQLMAQAIDQTKTPAPNIQHTNVYSVPKKFGGWPANHGIWSWGNEILVGFSAGTTKDLGPAKHNIDREKPEEHLLARSLDGGQTWTIENPAAKGALIPIGKTLHGITPPGLKEKIWQDCSGGINFTDPNFVMALRMTDHHVGPSRFYYSLDRGKNWQGPFRLTVNDPDGKPLFIAARTNYIVNGPHDCLAFLTAGKSSRDEGRIFCARTTDGAKTWQFVGWVGEEPEGYAIMPSAIRIDSSELLCSVRCRDSKKAWIDVYRSTDDGKNWKLDTTPVPDAGEGNPPAMIRLTDGRVCLTYGVRAEPYEMRARLSSDSGHSWHKEIVLRGNGGGRDIGYPATVQRPDGKIVTIYYFHDQPASDRYIAATIWNPDQTTK